MDELLTLLTGDVAAVSKPQLQEPTAAECEEYQRLREEEVLALSSIFGDDFEQRKDFEYRIRVRLLALSDHKVRLPMVHVTFIVGDWYPATAPMIEISESDRLLTREAIDEMYERMMAVCESRPRGTPVIWDLMEEAAVFVEEHATSCEVKASVEAQPHVIGTLTAPAGATLRAHRHRVDVDVWNPSKFLTCSISGILDHIGSVGLRVLHVENILNPRLVAGFQDLRTEYDMKYWKENIQPEVAFHGTANMRVGSIVRTGLVVPDGEKVTHATDSGWWGKGIYLSPDLETSLRYCRGDSKGGRLLVCAVLRGRTYQCQHLMQGGALVPGFDSHVSPSRVEWIFFRTAQILPCYAVHFQGVSCYQNKPPTEIDVNAAIKLAKTRKKEEKMKDKLEENMKNKLETRARKFLPFGFGDGKNLAILDAGEIDDDEEEFGEYQMDRWVDQPNGECEVEGNPE